MTCDEPGCTGIHSAKKPYRTLCPRAKRQHNDRPYRQSPGGQVMKYLADLRYARRTRDGKED